MSEKERLKENQEVTKEVAKQQDNYVNEQTEKVSKEAVEIVNLVSEVAKTLSSKDKEKSISTIEKALGKLEVLIAKDPKLSYIPVDVKEQIIDFPGTIDDIKLAKELVADFIDDGEVQKARDIMLQLASELDIYITMLPTLIYPEALKAIIPYVEKEEFEKAEALLANVIQQLVVEKIVIPLPIVRANETIKRAHNLTQDEKTDKEELKKLLAYAKEQLELAQELGYGKIKEDYKGLFEEIEKLEKTLEGDEDTKDIFKTLKEKLSSFTATFNKAHKTQEIKKEEK